MVTSALKCKYAEIRDQIHYQDVYLLIKSSQPNLELKEPKPTTEQQQLKQDLLKLQLAEFNIAF